jgi:isoleucyl-tRNA synthetase
MTDVILEEVNIKELEILEDDSSIVSKSSKPNFKVIGPKYGKMVKPLAAAIREITKDQIAKLETNGELTLQVNGEDIKITAEDVEIQSSEIEGWMVESEGNVTVAVDKELNEELIAEGYAREFVNRVQNMRKDSGLDVVDRIKVFYKSDKKFVDFIEKFSEYIGQEILADVISSDEADKEGFTQEWEIGDFVVNITIIKTA